MKKLKPFFGILFFYWMTAFPAAGMAVPDVTAALNELIQTSTDARDGYFASAQQVQNPDLKKLFLEFTKERSEFVQELEKKIKDAGDIPVSRGTVEGVFYRGWIDVKTALTQNDDLAVLTEVEKAEGVGLSRYEESLKNTELPSDVRTTLEYQTEKIRSAKQLIGQLEEATRQKVPDPVIAEVNKT